MRHHRNHAPRFVPILAVVLVSTLVLVALSAPPVSADEEPRSSFELSLTDALATLLDDDERLATFRGVHRFRPRWAAEAALGIDDARFSDEWQLDLSIRYTFLRTRRLDFFVLGGPGYSWHDASFATVLTDPDGFPAVLTREAREDSATVHLGFGLEIDLTDRLYLRPEVRHRWLLASSFFDDEDTDLGVSLGWRF
jgi:hypothetical protein